MNGLALCSGYGGLELGLSLAGDALGCSYRSVCHVEREAYAATCLVARMEDQTLDCAPIWDDLGTFDGAPWRGTVDIVTAGFPCQPWSAAGVRGGIDDARWLWPEIARIIREVGPQYVFLENVRGLISGGGLRHVLGDLADCGFDAEWDLFRASDLGAPHRRERVFILAHRQSGDRRGELPPGATSADGRGGFAGSGETMADGAKPGREGPGLQRRIAERGGAVADAEGGRGGQRERKKQPGRDEAEGAGGGLGDADGDRCGQTIGGESENQRPFPPSPNERDEWRRILERAPQVEPAVCGVVDGVADRLDRLRLAGNGVVPIVAAYAFITLAARIRN